MSGPLHVVNHAPPARFMRPLAGAWKPETTLAKGTAALDGHRWFISSGTLLGLVRDGGFIGDDTDIDTMLLADWDNPPDLALDGLTPLRDVDWQSRPMQRAFYDDNHVIFDVYVLYRRDDDYFNVTDAGEIVIPGRLVNLAPLDTPFGTLPAPDPPEDYLAFYYGDWQTPRHSKGILTGGA